MRNKNDEISIVELWHLFQPKLWLIALAAVLCAGALTVYTQVFIKDTYTSEASICVYNGNPEQFTTSSNLSVARLRVPLYMKIAVSDTFLGNVKNELPAEYEELSVSAIRSMIKTSQYEETEMFYITVTSQNSKVAYDVANAISVVAEKVVENKPMNGLLALGTTVQIIDRPVEATRPDSRGLTRNILIGALVGVVLSALIIFIASLFDVVIRDKKKIEDNFEIPLLGLIPSQTLVVDEKGEEA